MWEDTPQDKTSSFSMVAFNNMIFLISNLQFNQMMYQPFSDINDGAETALKCL